MNCIKSWLLLILLIVGAPFLHADNYPKNPKIDVLHYIFRIKLADHTDEITCAVTVDVRYAGAGINQLRLDLVNARPELGNKGMRVTDIVSEGKTLEYTHENDALLISLPAASVPNQHTSYTIIYSGIPVTGLKIANNKYGDRTFFSDNWPDKGRNWLSIIDHPYDKASCEFIVTAPAHYQVVSNGLLKEETDLADGHRITHWKQSVPIASWLYVLGVARFAVQQVDTFEGKEIQTWVYYQDRDAGFHDFAVPTKSVLEYYSEHIGTFVYEKLANIQSNSVSGGMEAASAILYSENSVVGDRNERWRNVVIHEIAHQWFGNAVTEYDWDDVWLSEGFATYFTLLYIQHAYGRDAFLDGLAKSKQRVDAFTLKNPTYRIIHDNLQDMDQVTSSQTYQKGSWILHMLRGVMGTEDFWKGIRSYYNTYMNKNASTTDFRIAMEEASGMDLKTFFEQWLYQPGALKLTGSWNYDKKNKKIFISLSQTQKEGGIMIMPLEIAIHLPNQPPIVEKVTIDKQTNEYSFSVASDPEKIVLDPNTWLLMDVNFSRK